MTTEDKKEQRRRHIGPYEVGRTLGEGTFGKVRLGTNIFTGEKVAIKTVKYKSIKSDTDRKHIEREKTVMSLLNHPNIVKLHKVVEDPERGCCYMILEYVSGGELFDYIVSHGRIKEKDARKFIRQIISALEYCHAHLVIHRDLKPENLLLDENLNIKITDFGLSNIIKPGQMFSTFCGSLHYACPEILKGEEYVGPGVDIWAMGVILYCLVIGSQPWDGKNSDELIDQIFTEGLVIPDWLSDDCANLIISMLRVKEKDRITLAEMKKHPWVLKDYDTPPPCYLPERDRVAYIDEEIMGMMIKIGFSDTADIRSEILSNNKTQLVATYHLLLQKRNEERRERGELSPHSKRKSRKHRRKSIEIKDLNAVLSPNHRRKKSIDITSNSGVVSGNNNGSTPPNGGSEIPTIEIAQAADEGASQADTSSAMVGGLRGESPHKPSSVSKNNPTPTNPTTSASPSPSPSSSPPTSPARLRDSNSKNPLSQSASPQPQKRVPSRGSLSANTTTTTTVTTSTGQSISPAHSRVNSQSLSSSAPPPLEKKDSKKTVVLPKLNLNAVSKTPETGKEQKRPHTAEGKEKSKLTNSLQPIQEDSELIAIEDRKSKTPNATKRTKVREKRTASVDHGQYLVVEEARKRAGSIDQGLYAVEEARKRAGSIDQSPVYAVAVEETRKRSGSIDQGASYSVANSLVVEEKTRQRAGSISIDHNLGEKRDSSASVIGSLPDQSFRSLWLQQKEKDDDDHSPPPQPRKALPPKGTPKRPVLNLEDIKNKQIKPTPGAHKRKPIISPRHRSNHKSIHEIFELDEDQGASPRSDESSDVPEHSPKGTAHSAMFGCSTTSNLPTKEIRQRISTVLTEQSVQFKRDESNIFKCSVADIKLEIEIVKIAQFKNLKGVKLSRISGDIWGYKAICDKIIASLNFA